MQEFPKMLYIGSTQSHKPEIAQNQDHEDELRELGFVDFADLESEVEHPEDFIMDMRTGKPKTVPQDVYDQVFADRQNLESENEKLKGQLSKALEENQQLQLVIDSFKTESVNAANETQVVGDITPIETRDYNSLTTPQLQKLLDEKGIAYLKRDNKDTLLALLTQPVKAEE